MKRSITTLVTIFLLLTTLLIPVNASDDGTTISPAIIELTVTQSYGLTIQNTSTIAKTYSIVPALFQTKSGAIVPFDEEDQQINFNNYINIAKSEVTIQSNSQDTVQINYLQEMDDYYLGVFIVEKSSSNSEVAISTRLASVIVNYAVSSEQLSDIQNNLKVNLVLGISTINLGSSAKIETTIANDTSKILNPSGEIIIYSGKTRIDNISLTQDMSKLYPSYEFHTENTYKDTRPFWKRLGKATYTQNVKVGDQIITINKEVINIPWEIIVLGILSLLILYLGLFKLSKKRRSATKKVVFEE